MKIRIPRMLVCGGRNYSDRYLLNSTLYRICEERGWITRKDEFGNYLPRVYLISGGARGADSMAEEWAVLNWVNIERYPAQWDVYGKSAGYIRNRRMLEEGKPDLVVAFPGGNGTANMVSIARKADVEVIEIGYE